MKLRTTYGFLLALPLLTSCTQNGAGSTAFSAEQIANRARPATVEVVARFQAEGTVSKTDLNFDQLKRDLSADASSADSEHALFVKLFDLLLSNPSKYLQEGDKTSFEHEFTSLGSGFIVTPDGYVLTNAHVVQASEDEFADAVAEALSPLINSDIEEIKDSFQTNVGGEIDEERLQRLRTALAKFYVGTLDLKTTAKVTIAMPPPPGVEPSATQYRPSEIRKLGEPTPGRDVAVLKMEGDDLPTLALAPAGNVNLHVGSPLFIDGYPGKVTLDPAFTKLSRMQPSQTVGDVSGFKQMQDGWQVIQTAAAMTPGVSGSPVLDQDEHVVGLATFSEKDSQGLNFAVSIDVARQFLDNLNVKPRESTFTQQYELALQEYERPGHGQALERFKDLRDRYPDVGTVAQFVHDLQVSPPDQQMQASRHSPVVLFGGIVLVIGILVLIIASGRR